MAQFQATTEKAGKTQKGRKDPLNRKQVHQVKCNYRWEDSAEGRQAADNFDISKAVEVKPDPGWDGFDRAIKELGTELSGVFLDALLDHVKNDFTSKDELLATLRKTDEFFVEFGFAKGGERLTIDGAKAA